MIISIEINFSAKILFLIVFMNAAGRTVTFIKCYKYKK